jgi:hypothetical protein
MIVSMRVLVELAGVTKDYNLEVFLVRIHVLWNSIVNLPTLNPV